MDTDEERMYFYMYVLNIFLTFFILISCPYFSKKFPSLINNNIIVIVLKREKIIYIK